MSESLQTLSTCALFSGIEPAQYPAVIRCLRAQVRTYQKEERLFSAGDAPSFLGVVLRGSVALLQEDTWGGQVILSVVLAGGVFAESFALSDGGTLPFSAAARTDSRILCIPTGELLSPAALSCPFHTRLIHNLIRILTQENLRLLQKIRHLSQKTTRQKVMSYLASQAAIQNSSTFCIPLDRQEMADYLGVERSALSAVLSQMQREGLIRFAKNRFSLLDRADTP